MPRPLLTLLASCLIAQAAWGVTIQLDYSLDTGGWFGDPASPRRTALEAAADFYSPYLTDTLDPIIPDAPNDPDEFGSIGRIPGRIWAGIISHPGTGAIHREPGLVVPADTLIVYIGARDLDGNALGVGGPGGFDAKARLFDTADWIDDIVTRGEAGITNGSGSLLPSPTDFAPWGGAISFDTTTSGGADRRWNLDPTIAPAYNEFDLFTVALHEMAHVLGFGTAASFDALVDSANDEFLGAASSSLWSGDVPLHADESHWQTNLTSPVYAGGPIQETLMDPDLGVNLRKRATELDMAGLDDLGWDIAPYQPLLGDLDGDLDVDNDDLTILLNNWNTLVGVGEGNLDGLGLVDDRDLGLLLAHWTGNLSGNQLTNSAAPTIPEPATVLLLTAFALLPRRRTGK